MTLNDKCLLVLKPIEPFRQWLTSTVQASEEAIQKEASLSPAKKLEITLEDIQVDASCYIMPSLPPEETAEFIQEHTEKMFSTELNTWCKVPEVWPMINYSNFISSFEFDFYFDWMNFNNDTLVENNNNLSSIILLIKPNEKFTDYLRTLLVEKFSVSPQEVDKKLDKSLIQNGSTVVITDIDELDEVERFLEAHAEEIFKHQLVLWGGENSEEFWPRDTDLRALKEEFTIEIHRHTYLMLH